MSGRLAGQEPGDLQFDLSGLSEFEKAVVSKALEIPKGEVRPYAWVAAEIGQPQAMRAVGSALGRNPVPLLIPCHRVVRSDGQAGNHVFGAEVKRVLLAAEGAQPEQLERLAHAGIRFYGSNTTRILLLSDMSPCPAHRRRPPCGLQIGAPAVAAGYRPCKICRPCSRLASGGIQMAKLAGIGAVRCAEDQSYRREVRTVSLGAARCSS